MLNRVIIDDNILAQLRLNIYRNNFKANLRSALASTYPVLKKLLGPEYFQYLADTYSKKHPPRSGNLRLFGRDLPDFLPSVESAKHLPYLRDVASLEWACSVISLAASPTYSDLSSIETLAFDSIANLHFGARLSSRVVRSRYPVFSIWLRNQDTYIGNQTVNLADGAQSVMVVRPDRELELWPLDEAETVFAEALIKGATLAEAVDAVSLGGHEIELNRLFERYLRKGGTLFSKVDNASCP